MAWLPVIFGFCQKCPECRQRSNPRPDQGAWEIMGVWNGAIHKCTACGTLVRVGFLTDTALTAEESSRFVAARDRHLGSGEKARDRGVDGIAAVDRGAAMLSVIIDVYECGKAADSAARLRDWNLKKHAETALRNHGVEGLRRYYENCLRMRSPQSDWVVATLREYRCPTLEDVRHLFMAAYRGESN